MNDHPNGWYPTEYPVEPKPVRLAVPGKTEPTRDEFIEQHIVAIIVMGAAVIPWCLVVVGGLGMGILWYVACACVLAVVAMSD